MTRSDMQAIIANVPAEKFKSAFLSWWGESEHQGWSGFTPPQVMDFEVVMEDFATYCESGGLEEYGGFMSFGGVQLDMSTGDPVEIRKEVL